MVLYKCSDHSKQGAHMSERSWLDLLGELIKPFATPLGFLTPDTATEQKVETLPPKLRVNGDVVITLIRKIHFLSPITYSRVLRFAQEGKLFKRDLSSDKIRVKAVSAEEVMRLRETNSESVMLDFYAQIT